MENFTKERLNAINYHSLRELAEKVGVRAPTTKNKELLIDEIIKIQNGELKPHCSKRGPRLKKKLDFLLDNQEVYQGKILELKLLAKRMLEIISTL